MSFHPEDIESTGSNLVPTSKASKPSKLDMGSVTTRNERRRSTTISSGTPVSGLPPSPFTRGHTCELSAPFPEDFSTNEFVAEANAAYKDPFRGTILRDIVKHAFSFLHPHPTPPVRRFERREGGTRTEGTQIQA